MNNILPAIYENIRNFYRRTFWERPGALTEDGDGYVLNYSGNMYMSGANQLWIDDPTKVDSHLLDYATRFFRRHRAEWSILIVPEVHPGLMQRCINQGAFEMWSNPIMYYEGIPELPCDPLDVHVEIIWNNIQRYTASSIISEAFQMEQSASRYIFLPIHDADDSIYHYIANIGDYPAGVATLTFSKGMAGIWNVGTRRMFRRRCVAHALMYEMLLHIQHRNHAGGCLIASNQGKPLYQKLGFQTVANACYMGLSSY